MKQRHTKQEIEETICKWTSYLLENKMIDNDEAKAVLGEALFKRAIAAMSKLGKNIVGKFGQIVSMATKNIHDQFASNSAIKTMIEALNNIKKKAPNFDFNKVNITATIDKETFPVLSLALTKGIGKTKLFLLICKDKKDGKPISLPDLKKFFIDKLGESPNIMKEIDGIYCADVPQNMLSESKITDYLEKENLSIKDAKKPENIKILKKLSKNSEKKVLDAIDKFFSKKDTESGKEDNLSKTAKKSKKSKKHTKKTIAKSKVKKQGKKPTSSEPSEPEKPADTDPKLADQVELEKPAETSKPEKPISDKEAEKTIVKSMKLLENDFQNVGISGNSVNFIFGKNKKQIALDNSQVDEFFKT